MPNATNVTIRKVFKGKSGEGQYGPWQAYDVYFEGSENKYSYFGDEKKPKPVIGQKITFMEFEVVKKGQYTNRTIKKMVLGQTPTEKPQGGPQATNGNNKAYIDHGKCVLMLMEMAGGSNCDLEILGRLIGIFRTGIDLMLAEPEDHSEEAHDYADGEFGEPPPIDDEQIPF